MSDESTTLAAAMEVIASMNATVVKLQEQIDESNASIDIFFVFAMGVICFLLQAGFGLLEAGSIRAKNAQNIMFKNMMDAVVTAIIYYVIGYSISYSPGGNSFIGGTELVGLKIDNISNYDYLYWYFNYVFAGTTATIVSGAVAERCQFRAYLIYSTVLAGFIYPVCAHWIWSADGFLYGKVYDFAGGGAVHMVGGWAAALGALILGPRVGKFVVDPQTGKKKAVDIPGHNMTLAVLGVLILWFGFFAFNGGSSYTIAGEAQFNAVGRAVVCTTLGGACGALLTMVWGYAVLGHWDIPWTVNGLLGGMVAICSGANAIHPWAAIITGLCGAAATQLQVLLFEHVLFIDDPLNASAVHLGAGAAGMITVAFLAEPEFTGGGDFTGIFYGGSFSFLGQQFYGMAVYSAWTIATSGVMFFGLKAMGWFRVDLEEEMLGVDKSHHGGSAYPIDDHTAVYSNYTPSRMDTDSEGKADMVVEPEAAKQDEIEEVNF